MLFPKPFSSCCWNPMLIDVSADGLKRRAGEVEELRVLFQETNMLVPGENPCVYCVLNVDVCAESSLMLLRPVPEIKGLFTGITRESIEYVPVTCGSKLSPGMLA